MALPTSDDLQKMDYGYFGQPFVCVPAKSIDLTAMDYGYWGQPFVTNPYPSGATPSGPAHLKTWCGVDASHIKTFCGTPLANIKTLDGVS